MKYSDVITAMGKILSELHEANLALCEKLGLDINDPVVTGVGEEDGEMDEIQVPTEDEVKNFDPNTLSAQAKSVLNDPETMKQLETELASMGLIGGAMGESVTESATPIPINESFGILTLLLGLLGGAGLMWFLNDRYGVSWEKGKGPVFGTIKREQELTAQVDDGLKKKGITRQQAAEILADPNRAPAFKNELKAMGLSDEQVNDVVGNIERTPLKTAISQTRDIDAYAASNGKTAEQVQKEGALVNAIYGTDAELTAGVDSMLKDNNLTREGAKNMLSTPEGEKNVLGMLQSKGLTKEQSQRIVDNIKGTSAPQTTQNTTNAIQPPSSSTKPQDGAATQKVDAGLSTPDVSGAPSFNIGDAENEYRTAASDTLRNSVYSTKSDMTATDGATASTDNISTTVTKDDSSTAANVAVPKSPTNDNIDAEGAFSGESNESVVESGDEPDLSKLVLSDEDRDALAYAYRNQDKGHSFAGVHMPSMSTNITRKISALMGKRVPPATDSDANRALVAKLNTGDVDFNSEEAKKLMDASLKHIKSLKNSANPAKDAAIVNRRVAGDLAKIKSEVPKSAYTTQNAEESVEDIGKGALGIVASPLHAAGELAKPLVSTVGAVADTISPKGTEPKTDNSPSVTVNAENGEGSTAAGDTTVADKGKLKGGEDVVDKPEGDGKPEKRPAKQPETNGEGDGGSKPMSTAAKIALGIGIAAPSAALGAYVGSKYGRSKQKKADRRKFRAHGAI